jgi:hypothetical protein
MRVLCLTSDKYLHAVKVYAWLFEKYWNSEARRWLGEEQQVLVAGFTPPDFDLPKNFEFYSIGKFSDYPVGRWSDALIALLEEIEDEAFVLMLEDYWITRPVNVPAIKMLYDYALQFKDILRIDLTTDRLFAYGPRYPQDVPDAGYCGWLDLVYSEPTSAYHLSMMTGIWRRDNLLKVLIPNESPWQVELDGTRRVMEKHAHSMRVIGTRQWPIRHTLGFRGGNPGEVHLDDLRAEDILALKERGLV